MSVKSTRGSPKGDLVNDIRTSLDSIFKSQTTIGGTKLHTVSPSKLEQLERRIDRALATQGETQESPTELLAMHDQVERLKADNAKLAGMLKGREEEVFNSTNELKSLRSQLSDAEATHKVVKASNDKLNATLRDDLVAAKTDLANTKAAQQSAAAKFDPDAAIQLKAAHAAAKLQVQNLTKELEKSNAASKQAQVDAQTLRVRVQNAEDNLKVHKGRALQLKNALALADDTKSAIRFSPAIETLLGKDACLILSNWQSAAADDVKERAYIGMTGLKKHSNKLLRSLGLLFEKVFQWCKTQTIGARKALKPWMDMIIDDVSSAKIKAISFYRDELKALTVIIDEKKHALATSGHMSSSEEDGFFSDLWFYGYAIALRVRRRSRGLIEKIADSVKSLAHAIRCGGQRAWSSVMHLASRVSKAWDKTGKPANKSPFKNGWEAGKNYQDFFTRTGSKGKGKARPVVNDEDVEDILFVTPGDEAPLAQKLD